MPPTPGNFEFLLRNFGVAMDGLGRTPEGRIMSMSGPSPGPGACIRSISGLGFEAGGLALGASAVPALGVTKTF